VYHYLVEQKYGLVNNKEMMAYTLITGATSGIGLELAKLLAAAQTPLVISGRNTDKLAQTKTILEALGAPSVRCYAADLSQQQGAQQLYDVTKRDNVTVSTLVNNAGVGMYGCFVDTVLSDEVAMIQTNVASVVVLSKLYAKDMQQAGGGTILNVSSLLAFLPFPYYSVYSATKAFVLAFSETIAAELVDDNVQVLTLCPGPVDTPFNTNEMWQTNAYNANKPMPAATVAAAAMKLLQKGSGKKIPGFNNWFISNLPRVTPDYLMMKIKKHLASKR
jgi:short-subunit dehydrogenase